VRQVEARLNEVRREGGKGEGGKSDEARRGEDLYAQVGALRAQGEATCAVSGNLPFGLCKICSTWMHFAALPRVAHIALHCENLQWLCPRPNTRKASPFRTHHVKAFAMHLRAASSLPCPARKGTSRVRHTSCPIPTAACAFPHPRLTSALPHLPLRVVPLRIPASPYLAKIPKLDTRKCLSLARHGPAPSAICAIPVDRDVRHLGRLSAVRHPARAEARAQATLLPSPFGGRRQIGRGVMGQTRRPWRPQRSPSVRACVVSILMAPGLSADRQVHDGATAMDGVDGAHTLGTGAVPLVLGSSSPSPLGQQVDMDESHLQPPADGSGGSCPARSRLPRPDMHEVIWSSPTKPSPPDCPRSACRADNAIRPVRRTCAASSASLQSFGRHHIRA
jgi:hypothetical protein